MTNGWPPPNSVSPHTYIAHKPIPSTPIQPDSPIKLFDIASDMMTLTGLPMVALGLGLRDTVSTVESWCRSLPVWAVSPDFTLPFVRVSRIYRSHDPYISSLGC